MENIPAIRVERLNKSYGKLNAVKDVSFSVGYGEIFGLIGPDGAGKTSIFKILTTLINPDSGTSSVGGMDIISDYKNIRKHIGYMPGKFSLYHDLSIKEHLEFFASIFDVNIEDSYRIIEPIYKQLEPFSHRPAGKLSGGMKQKLALCCALVHMPEILLLDEPTTGVDAVSRKEFWDMLKGLRDNGLGILVSTPYMDEAARCDRIALIHKGEILGIDTPAGIRNGYKERLFAISSDRMYDMLRSARMYPGVKNCYTAGETHHLVTDEDFDPKAFKEEMVSQGYGNVHIETIAVGIEDVFISLMSKRNG